MKINASVDFPTGSKFILVENFFPDNLASDINSLFTLPKEQWYQDPVFAHCPGRLSLVNDHATKQAIDVYARSMQQQIGQAIGQEVVYDNHSLWLDLPGYTIPPHTDQEGLPWVSVQIYMGDPDTVWEMLGFCIYTEQRRALFEAHYRINAGYICLYPHKIVHGLNHHIAPQFVRNSVYMRYRLK